LQVKSTFLKIRGIVIAATFSGAVAQPDLAGFSDITVYPDELSWEYTPKRPLG
jgi:hypothetical protein